jgi:hypothetical protein
MTSHRRGNTLVLVAAILVLLVIIATSYLTRTQTQRATAVATRDGQLDDSNADLIAEMISQEIALALFPRPVDPNGDFSPNLPTGTPGAADANWPHLAIPMDAARYGIDLNYPYNRGQYEVVPWTNPPDFTGTNADFFLPRGDGNPTVAVPGVIDYMDNPRGNPGYGDARWLRSSEPLRWDADNDGFPERYSHWSHLSNLSRAGNGWRVCRDIANVLVDDDGDGINDEPFVVYDLNVPIEQWSALRPGDVIPGRNDAWIVADDSFATRWQLWMTSWTESINPALGNYASEFGRTGETPANYYRLSDLDGDGEKYNYTDAFVDEYVPGGKRHWLSRVLTDSDGDGYTDAFWHLAPLPAERGIRTLVAVSIIDNGGMLNANVASRFSANDASLAAGVPAIARKTTGATPADVALVGDFGDGSNAATVPYDAGLRVGLLDNPEHWASGRPWPPWFLPFGNNDTAWGREGLPQFTDLSRWEMFLTEIGVNDQTAYGFTQGAELSTQLDRVAHWRLSGRHAGSPEQALPEVSGIFGQPGTPFTPFSLADEVELRMHQGQNYPWVFTNFERALGKSVPPDPHPLHAWINAEESSEFSDQLRNHEMVTDLRSKLTLYNGTRNDILAPWLWKYQAPPDLNNDNIITVSERNAFEAGRRKYDLRYTPDEVDLDGDGSFGDVDDRRLDRERLQDIVTRSLIDADELGMGTSYLGETSSLSQVEEVELAAASLTANMIAYRDNDDDPNNPNDDGRHVPLALEDALFVSPSGSPTSGKAFVGLEPQPFIVEAFIGHVYEMETIPTQEMASLGGSPYLNASNDVIFANDDFNTTVVAVQLMNPFAHPISLEDFEIELFGQRFDLGNANLVLNPTTPEAPYSIVLYAIDETFGGATIPGFQAKWLDFLDLEAADHGNQFLTLVKVGDWSTDRQDYDDSNDSAIVLLRQEPPDPGVLTPVERVVVDRIDPPDDRRFGDEVNDLGNDRPISPQDDKPDLLDGFDVPDPIGGIYEPGIDLGPPDPTASQTHWVQWVRATRAWGIDVNRDDNYDADERNPRFVFAERAVIRAAKAKDAPPPVRPDVSFTTGEAKGNRYNDLGDPDDWFIRDYVPMSADIPDDPPDVVPVRRKPTFFDHNDVMNTGYPDKGWYGQGADQLDPVDTHAMAPDNTLDGRGFPMQMLVKNADFEQVGEVMNVFLWGHQLKVNLRLNDVTGRYEINAADPLDADGEDMGTERTFSEFMSDANYSDETEDGIRINRLNPRRSDSIVTGVHVAAQPANDLRDAVPDLPAAVRLADAFVCDSAGLDAGDQNLDGISDTPFDRFLARYGNAQGFSGQATPGMININTASTEVLHALPHMFRLVHEFNSPITNPRVMVAEAIGQYRNRMPSRANANLDLILAANPASTAFPDYPDYGSRDDLVTGLRGGAGFASPGELQLLTQSTAGDTVDQYPHPTLPAPEDLLAACWRIDQGALDGISLFTDSVTNDPDPARLSIDTNDVDFDEDGLHDDWDPVAADAEEANLLFAGMSNLVTTRSDVFTVYFKIRSFRQNPQTGAWDATDREYIVDESRYVMLVDRSEVNTPLDRPKILYLEKLPN